MTGHEEATYREKRGKKKKNALPLVHIPCKLNGLSVSRVWILDPEYWRTEPQPYTRIKARLWLKMRTQEKDAKRNSFKWSGAVGGLQGEFRCGSPVKILQGRLGEYISDYKIGIIITVSVSILLSRYIAPV